MFAYIKRILRGWFMEITQEVLDAIKAARAGYEAALDADVIHEEASANVDDAIEAEKDAALDSLQAHKDAAEEAQKALDEVEKFLGIDVKPDPEHDTGGSD